MRLKKPLEKLLRYVGVALVVAFIIGTVIWYYYPIWTIKRLDYIIARTGSIDYQVQVNAVFVNDEHLIYAPASGTVTFNVEEKQRYRRGEIIGAVQSQGGASVGGGKNTPIVIGVGGLFYKTIDGLEGVLTRNNLLNMDLNALLAQKGTLTGPFTTVTSGAPVGKIVNNHTPTTAFVEFPAVEGLELRSYAVGDRLRFEAHGRSYTAKILRVSESPRGFVVEFDSFVNDSVIPREQLIVWNYKNSPEGIIVPQSALVIKGEEKGVLVVVEGVIRFRRVKILDQNQELACVENITEGMTVITTPRLELEGRPWTGKK